MRYQREKITAKFVALLNVEAIKKSVTLFIRQRGEDEHYARLWPTFA